MSALVPMPRGAVAAQLRAVRALIPTPRQWCKGAYAKGPRGRDTETSSPDACRRCLVAALAAVLGCDMLGTSDYAAHAALEAELPVGKYDIDGDLDPLEWFNDWGSTRHADVLALIDRAIAKAERGVS